MGIHLDRFLESTTRVTLALVALWTLAVLGSMVMDLRQTDAAIEELARAEARGVFNKDLAYRRWAAQHGGVYVPATTDTPPNPHLAHVAERDIVSPSGRHLTLMNPAYMTREVHELSEVQYGLRGHITSLKPLRPENAPEDWERTALEAFEEGTLEYSEIGEYDGGSHLRLMRPMRTEAGCLKCHGDQRYVEGDIRGGVSVAVPMAPYEQIAAGQKKTEILGHGAFYLLGLVGLGVGGALIRRRRLDRQAAEVARARSEALYQDLFDSAPVPYFIVGADGRVEEANRASAEFTGHGADVLRGIPMLDLHDEGSRAAAQDAFEQVALGRAVINRQMTYRTAHGEEAVGLLSVAPIEDGVGQVVRSRAVVLDITEHKKLQNQLHVAQRLEAIGRLAGGVAHDFNNLLTVILSYAGFLEIQLADDPKSCEDVRMISEAADRAARLTSQLLTFSSRHAQRLEVLAPGEIVADLHKLLTRVLGEDIDLDVSTPDDVGHVRGDRSQLEQIVMNLAVNARDAMPGGGKLTIELANADLDDRFTESHTDVEPGEYVLISVTDSGEGMDAETRSKIFEPFFTTKAVGKGTGLGLATVYGIVKQSQGHVWVYSEVGHGTTFKVFLPRVADSPSRPECARVSVEDLGGTETILLAEDENAVREATRRTLAGAGYTVIEAEDGDVAREICARGDRVIHLLLTDVVMPGSSGAAVAATFQETNPGRPAVFMSGYTDKAIAQHGELPAGTRLLDKPFAAATLLRLVREALDE